MRGPVGQKLAIWLAFGSSAAVMVLELVSLRLVAPYIGLTLETNTAVIGGALAAIATGAALGGRFADTVPPQRTLGPLILLGGALVMLVLPVVRWTGESLRGGANDLVFLVLAVTLFAPAALLSAVTPMVTKLRLDTLTQTGTVVGRLSAYATVGGIVGTVLIGVFSTSEGAGGVDGLLYGGGAGSLGDQTLGVLVAVAYSGVLTTVIALAIKYTIGLRLDEEDEVNGIDLAAHGESAYDLHSGTSGGGTGILAASTTSTSSTEGANA